MAVRVRRWSDVEARRAPFRTPSALGDGPLNASGGGGGGRRSGDDDAGRASVATATPAAAAVTLSVVEDEGLAPEECVICLDDLETGRAIFRAECGHRFHFSCLLENVNHDEANADKCPICRKSQTHWPEQTKGLVKAHPYCTSSRSFIVPCALGSADSLRATEGTNCGKRGAGGQFCDGCGQSLAHTPTAQERARAAAAAAAARSNVVVECPTCRIRCLVSTSARGTLQCPNGHLFQLRMPPTTNSQGGLRQSLSSGFGAPRPVMRQCPTCYTRVQMPPGSQAGQYMCPHGHTFYYSPLQ